MDVKKSNVMNQKLGFISSCPFLYQFFYMQDYNVYDLTLSSVVTSYYALNYVFLFSILDGKKFKT